jgi:hypothetical protein
MVLASWKARALAAAGLVALLGFTSPARAQGIDGDGDGGPGGGLNAKPIIASLTAVQVPGRKFRISGRVADDTPGTCGVVITGAASGVAMCDANGNFDAIYDVPTLGQITAVPGDGTQSGDAVTRTLGNNPPTVNNFIAVQVTGGQWTFSGTVADECPAGLTVSLTGPAGVNGATATVAANGAWSVTVTPGAGGFVTATVTDWYSARGSAMTYFLP